MGVVRDAASALQHVVAGLNPLVGGGAFCGELTEVSLHEVTLSLGGLCPESEATSLCLVRLLRGHKNTLFVLL